MRNLTVPWLAFLGCLTLALASNYIRAAEDGEANGAINAIADQLQKGDTGGATKGSHAAASMNDLDIVMSAFSLRKKKGIGVGPKANAIVPDGIEKKVESLARDALAPAALQKEGQALARMGYVINAVALIAEAKAPLKDTPKQKKADWLQWSKGLATSSMAFVTAAKGTSPAELKKAAAKMQQNCDSCHAVFK